MLNRVFARSGALLLALGSLVAADIGGPALGAGFALREQSGTSQGHSFASATTGIEDISTMFFNPATMGFQKGHQGSVVTSYIVPRAEFDIDSATNAVGLPILPTSDFTGSDDVSKDALVPASYAMMSLTDDLKLGLAITAPFGLETSNPTGWEGRYHALNSRLTTVNFNPTVAYRINERLSVGAGFIAEYADAKLTSAVDFGGIGASFGVTGALPGLQDGSAEVRGDDWGFGGTAGIMYQVTNNTRLGLSYRSPVKHKLEGEGQFFLDDAGIGATLSALSGAFVDSDISAEATFPETVSFGVHHDINAQWAVMGEVAWTNWSRFDDLTIKFDNPAQDDNVTIEDWDDSWFFALGATYRPTPKWAIKAGVAYDMSPIPDDTRTPRIPGEDRYWISAGVTYTPLDWLSLTAGYTHVFMPSASIDLLASDFGNEARGNLSGDYENTSIDIFVLSASVQF
jgi:long-chain fatty acid transport protein